MIIMNSEFGSRRRAQGAPSESSLEGETCFRGPWRSGSSIGSSPNSPHILEIQGATRTRRSRRLPAASLPSGLTRQSGIDSQGNIITGFGRYLASIQLKLETVPVIVLDHLTETEKRAYLIADNKLAELSSFDDDLLREELAELRDTDIDLGALGFSDDELAVLLANADDGSEAGEDAEEEIPEAPAEPVTRAGDIWTISGHKIICGDCRDRDVVHRLFDGARANVVVTSPPYASQRE